VGDVVDGVQGGDRVDLTVDTFAGVLTVTVQGALVGSASAPLRECLSQAIRGGRPVVVDLTVTGAIDREGIDLLLDANRSLGTRLRLVVERGGEVHQAFRREGVAHVLSLHGSRAEALAAAGPR
jgi:anti-anti-sigma regulatory factor